MHNIMKNRTPEILNIERLLENREKHMSRLTDLFNGKYHLLPFGLAGFGVCIDVDITTDIVKIQDDTEALFDILADKAEEISITAYRIFLLTNITLYIIILIIVTFYKQFINNCTPSFKASEVII